MTTREVAETVIATTAPKATIVGVSAMGAGWITLDSAVTIIGAAVAIVGGWATWYYKRVAAQRAARHEAREVELHNLRKEWLRGRITNGSTDLTPTEAVEARVLGIDVQATDVNAEGA